MLKDKNGEILTEGCQITNPVLGAKYTYHGITQTGLVKVSDSFGTCYLTQKLISDNYTLIK